MFSTDDTIVAIATPPGRGGIGVVRVSGPRAHDIASSIVTYGGQFEPRRATLSRARRMRGASETIDQIVVTYFPAPHSYTGEDIVELSAHGSPVVLHGIVAAAMDGGARLAEPGEFTLRAFLNGRIDLVQAEAVADLVDAVTPLQARAAFDQLQGTLTEAIADLDARLFDLVARLEASVDFPDEGYHFVDPSDLQRALDELIARASDLVAGAQRGRLIREGLQVVIVGRPNVGKSSLFNALVGASRAIVTNVPGTTRDLITEVVEWNGIRVTLVDTAGLRETREPVETEGVARARCASRVADLILFVVDGSHPFDPCEVDDPALDNISQVSPSKRLIVINKADVLHENRKSGSTDACLVSAIAGTGLDDLRARALQALDREAVVDRPALTNARHIALVERAIDALERARDAVACADGRLSEEFVLADLQDARAALEEVRGRRTSDEVLAHIFERFCIGK